MTEHANRNPLAISKQLPFDLRMALVKAAATPITRGDPLARLRAIEEVRARFERSHPYLFNV